MAQPVSVKKVKEKIFNNCNLKVVDDKRKTKQARYNAYRGLAASSEDIVTLTFKAVIFALVTLTQLIRTRQYCEQKTEG